jgi:hypothetical protein
MEEILENMESAERVDGDKFNGIEIKNTPLCQLRNTKPALVKPSPHKRSLEEEEMIREVGASGNEKRQSSRKEKEKLPMYTKRQCYMCKELKNGYQNSHNTKYCFLREKNKKRVKGFEIDSEDETDSEESKDSSSSSDDEETSIQKMKQTAKNQKTLA